MTEDDLYDLPSPLADGRVYPYAGAAGQRRTSWMFQRLISFFLDTD